MTIRDQIREDYTDMYYMRTQNITLTLNQEDKNLRYTLIS